MNNLELFNSLEEILVLKSTTVKIESKFLLIGIIKDHALIYLPICDLIPELEDTLRDDNEGYYYLSETDFNTMIQKLNLITKVRILDYMHYSRFTNSKNLRG